MRALVCREYGTPDVLKLENDWPEPELRPGHVRIATHLAGISFAVVLGIAGKHQNKPGLPYVPGGEVAGIVIDAAPDVTHVKPGDRVAALAQGGGGIAERFVAPAHTVWKIPDGLDDAQAMIVAGTHGSVFLGLDWAARLRRGETLLVHGAGGGSGLSAVMLGRAMGARVIGTASSHDKREAAMAAGAEIAIDYRNEDMRARVLELTDGRGVDVVFDPVGGDLFDQSLRCVAPEARLVCYGFASGRIPQIPANILLVKNVTAIGYYWGYYLGWGRQMPKPETFVRLRETMAMLMQWAAEGRLPKMPVTSFPVADFRAAMRVVEESKAIGKIVLAF
ncbi:MAG: NADPH:quinone oxidoreductase family protein [Reyranellaceae bacterium]